ncbi:hypothetical protein QE385_003241 [Sphingomonas sp. SORGH_AS 950]|uniref:hypothetical protein n=1 Tax=Sphingomonas sp. SORGH_AS_0950 TaxID=3041792 RepID=UPI00278B636D|nr:hypothetical protein [Sphingomonas sp. SORGH_AS_0950]MDQ1158914.1 hypothetical protein [Sphingomonas sp. SORGH_AS_0950]
MTIGQLLERLRMIVALNPRSADIPVTFGPECKPVEGGIIRQHQDGATLNLAPLALDKVGGF